MKLPFLASATLICFALSMQAPAPTAPAVLPDFTVQKRDILPVCGTTKTLFGPFSLNYPVLGYSQSDEFYAVKLPDGTYEISVRGIHDLPFGFDKGQPYLDLNPKGGLRGGVVNTEMFQGSWGPYTKTSSFGGSLPSWPKPTPT
jgi:hypothetical protein